MTVDITEKTLPVKKRTRIDFNVVPQSKCNRIFTGNLIVPHEGHPSASRLFDSEAKHTKHTVLRSSKSARLRCEQFNTDRKIVHILPSIGLRHDTPPAMPRLAFTGNETIYRTSSGDQIMTAHAILYKQGYHPIKAEGIMRKTLNGTHIMNYDDINRFAIPIGPEMLLPGFGNQVSDRPFTASRLVRTFQQ